MRMDTPVANGDPTLAALIPEGVTLAHIIALFQTAYHVNGEQLLRARLSALGATHPANLAPPELAEFIKYMLGALKSAGIRDPAAVLAYGVRREAETAAAKLASSAAIGDIAAERKSDEHAPVTIENNSSTISDASTPRPVAQTIAYGTTKAEDERQPDKPATNIVPRTIANPQATAAAGDEIIIGERRFISERRLAAVLGRHPRTLQRWRTEQKGKGPPSTRIGRSFVYEINEVQEWMDRKKSR